MEKTVINITGMSCSHCVKAVEEAVSALAGVKKVAVKLKPGTAKVTFDPTVTTLADIKGAVAEAGFEAA